MEHRSVTRWYQCRPSPLPPIPRARQLRQSPCRPSSPRPTPASPRFRSFDRDRNRAYSCSIAETVTASDASPLTAGTVPDLHSPNSLGPPATWRQSAVGARRLAYCRDTFEAGSVPDPVTAAASGGHSQDTAPTRSRHRLASRTGIACVPERRRPARSLPPSPG